MRKIEELERRLRVRSDARRSSGYGSQVLLHAKTRSLPFSSDASEYVLKAPQGIINTANIIRLDSTIADLIDHVLSAELA